MPRKAPDGLGVTEHRITFGNKERTFIEQMMKQERTNAIIKGVGSGGLGLGVVVIGGGLAVAAYAFYHWAGLSDLPGKVKDGMLGVSTGIGETLLGTTVETQVQQFMGPITQKMEALKIYCKEKVDFQQAIIADPNSSENQKAQATLEEARILSGCKKKYQQFQMEMKAGLDNPEYVALKGTWLGNLAGL